MRLIDADKLHLKLLDMEFPIQDQDQILDAMDDCTIDAAPVVHGRWIDVGGGYVACSECGEEHGWEDYRASYCEDCGAKMDLPEDGE